jgi:hypothetical protein
MKDHKCYFCGKVIAHEQMESDPILKKIGIYVKHVPNENFADWIDVYKMDNGKRKSFKAEICKDCLSTKVEPFRTGYIIKES